MNTDLPLIRFHGCLAKDFKKEWRLNVKSISEAIHAINILTKRKFYKILAENDKKGIAYKIILNGKILKNDMKEASMEEAKKSHFCVNRKIETLDIVPVIQGSDFMDIFMIVIGAILIVVGAFTFYAGGFALIMAGIGLIAAGVANLLSKPPEVDSPRFQSRERNYAIDGATNTVGEGYAVPVNYGRLLVGSHSINANYSTVYEEIENQQVTKTRLGG